MDVPFTPQKWEFIGRTIAQSIAEYFEMLSDEEPQGKKKERKKEQAKTKRLPEIKPSSKAKHQEERNSEMNEEKMHSFEQIEKELFSTTKS